MTGWKDGGSLLISIRDAPMGGRPGRCFSLRTERIVGESGSEGWIWSWRWRTLLRPFFEISRITAIIFPWNTRFEKDLDRLSSEWGEWIRGESLCCKERCSNKGQSMIPCFHRLSWRLRQDVWSRIRDCYEVSWAEANTWHLQPKMKLHDSRAVFSSKVRRSLANSSMKACPMFPGGGVKWFLHQWTPSS